MRALEYAYRLNLVNKYIAKSITLTFPKGSEDVPIPGRTGHIRLNMQLGCLFALYPGVDTKNAAAFISSLICIADRLKALCQQSQYMDELTVRSIYRLLADAVDPEKSISGHLSEFKAEDSRYLGMHVEECRQQIAELPFYTTVSAKVKKYIQLYTDIQAYRVLPPKIRDNYLKSWAGCYTLRGPDTSCWEFAAASESLLCVFALYVSAFDPLLMQEDVKSIESTYFPWLCCYQTLLEHYAAPREILLGEELNYTDCYKNLKTCEERLDTLMKKSAEACKYLNNSNFHLIIIKILTAVYLSDPRASFGIKRLSSQSLLGKSLYKTEAYFHICRALRFLSVI